MKVANIIIVTHWTGGDVYPFIKIGLALKNQKHEVTVITHCCYEKDVKDRGLAFAALDDENEYEEFINDFPLLADAVKNLQGVQYFNEKYYSSPRIMKEVGIISKYCNRTDTILIARHRSSISALLVAEKYGFPVVPVLLAPNYLSHMDFHEEIMGKDMCEKINQSRSLLGLPLISSWKDWLLSPPTFIAAWPEWYAEVDYRLCPDVHFIGFITEKTNEETELDPEIEHLLNSKKTVALITGGTSKMLNPDFYKISAEACFEAGFSGILVTAYDQYIPKPLPEGIIHRNNLNLNLYLPKVNMVIHHGGIGTITEAIISGTPQIILPHLADRPDNALRIQSFGIGLSFPPKKWVPKKMADSMKRFLESNYKEKCEFYKSKLINQDVSAELKKVIEKF